VNRVIAMFSILTVAILLSVAVMIYGWGLEPKSWLWIIGGGVGLRALVALLEILSKAEDK